MEAALAKAIEGAAAAGRLDVVAQLAMVTSGWGEDGLDIYRLSDTAAPVYDQFVRTRGWSINSLARQATRSSCRAVTGACKPSRFSDAKGAGCRSSVIIARFAKALGRADLESVVTSQDADGEERRR